MATIKAKWRNGILTFYDGSTYETVLPLAPDYFYDDFLNTQIQTAGAGVFGWTLQDTGAATEAIIANQTNGVVGLTLTNANEEQEAGLHWGDALNINLDKGPIFECRMNAAVLPTLLAECYFGICGAYVKGRLATADEGPLVHAVFMLDGSGTVTIHTDDAVTDNNAVATGITAVAGTYNIYRIDATDVTSVKFYIDGVQVATGTTFSMANGTDVVVQPYLMNYKNTGAGLGALYYDYVRFWCVR